VLVCGGGREVLLPTEEQEKNAGSLFTFFVVLLIKKAFEA
jgi:hypothetical protein